jgi:tetratricopeptide (TPR) repeat protein
MERIIPQLLLVLPGAVKINWAFTDAIFMSGEAKRKLKLNKEAAEDFSLIISINPSYIEAYLSRGELLIEDKKYKEALSDFTNVITRNPKKARAYLLRGEAYIKLKNKKNACTDFSKAGELGYFAAYEKIKKHCR